MEPVQGDPWPVGRAFHAACCLNYGDNYPKLIVYGGLGAGIKVLGDMWLLDVESGKWTEVRMLIYNYSQSNNVSYKGTSSTIRTRTYLVFYTKHIPCVVYPHTSLILPLFLLPGDNS